MVFSPGSPLKLAATIGLASALVAAAAFTAPAQIQAPSSSATASTAPAAKPASATATPKKKSTRKHHSSRREPSQKAPTPDRISEIQSALARDGFFDANPNGKWDSETIAALQKFQSANGLDATGKLDALSLQKLGLGSEIAGVYAPEPPRPAPAASPKPSTTAPVPATAQPQKPDSAAPPASNPQR